jgi:hypothetical protein
MDETTNLTGPENQIDRLVDGEMNETDRRELLLQFEREPEGWRRCALAFLEAQCWKQELGFVSRSAEAVRSEPSPALANPASVRTSTSTWPSTWRQKLATALTMGACFLIALALGLSWRGNGAGGSHDGSNVRSVKEEFPLSHLQAPGDELATIDTANGQPENLRIPGVRHDAIDANIADQAPSAMPPEVQRALQRAGYEVVQQREVVPLQINSDRHLMVPVDHGVIRYVGFGGRGSL